MIQRLHGEGWPPYLMENQVVGEHWGVLYEHFARFQFCFLTPDGVGVACGNSIPIPWDGTLEDLPGDIGEILIRADEARRNGVAPNTLCALAAIIDHTRQGVGLSREILETMGDLGREAGFGALIAPVRPNRKSHYPLIPMERYARWTRDDGSPFDPWLRVHWRLGAQILRVAPRALVIEGTVAEWENWTGMEFPESGSYVVPGGLTPVEIDRKWDRGVYEDPNVWMRHDLRAATPETPRRKK